jgi:hypothetical protein
VQASCEKLFPTASSFISDSFFSYYSIIVP